MQIFLNVWAIVGPLIGVALGSWLTTRNQRKHWIADNKKDEYRELLRILNTSTKTVSNFHFQAGFRSGEEERKVEEAKDEALIAIDTRLFIRDEIQKIKLRERWLSAIKELETGGHSLAFVRCARGIFGEISNEANRLLE